MVQHKGKNNEWESCLLEEGLFFCRILDLNGNEYPF